MGADAGGRSVNGYVGVDEGPAHGVFIDGEHFFFSWIGHNDDRDSVAVCDA